MVNLLILPTMRFAQIRETRPTSDLTDSFAS